MIVMDCQKWNQGATLTGQINNDCKLETSPLTHMVISNIERMKLSIESILKHLYALFDPT
jgi:hypothetical protein